MPVETYLFGLDKLMESNDILQINRTCGCTRRVNCAESTDRLWLNVWRCRATLIRPRFSSGNAYPGEIVMNDGRRWRPKVSMMNWYPSRVQTWWKQSSYAVVLAFRANIIVHRRVLDCRQPSGCLLQVLFLIISDKPMPQKLCLFRRRGWIWIEEEREW